MKGTNIRGEIKRIYSNDKEQKGQKDTHTQQRT